MAQSGTINGSFNGSNARYLEFRCDWSVVTQDLANKTSTVNIKWIVRKTTSSLETYKQATPWSQVCDGVTTSGTLNFDLRNVSANTDYVVRNVNVVIPHSADGTKNASISGTLDVTGTSAGSGSFGGSMQLPTIATTPPTVSALTVSDIAIVKNNQTAYQLVGAYVAGFTKLRLTANATAVSPATIASYSFYNGNTLLGTVNTTDNSASFEYNNPNAAGTYKFKVVVKDSFGNVTTYPSTVPNTVVHPYSKPVNSCYAERCNSQGTADPSGTYANLHVKWTITTFGTSPDNSATCQVTFMGNSYSRNNNTSQVISGVATGSSYDAVFVVTDALGQSSQITSTVRSEFVNLDMYPDGTVGGIGIGMISESGLASFNIPVKPYKGISVSNYIRPASVSDLNSAILSLFSSMSQQSIAWLEANPSVTLGSPFSTGSILFVEIMKHASVWGTVTAKTYDLTEGYWEWRASVANGAMSSWVTKR